MKELHTEVEIDASPENVWAALLESQAIPEPMKGAIAENRVGARTKAHLGAGGRGATFTMELLAAVAPKTVSWKGYMWVPGLFDGEHTFEIEPVPEGKVRFVQRESFRGLLLPFLAGTIEATRRDFEAANLAIKERAERIQR